MDWTPIVSLPQKKHTVAAGILGVILNQLSRQNNGAYFRGRNHPIQPRHLTNCMGKVEYPAPTLFTNPLKSVFRSVAFGHLRRPVFFKKP